MSKADDSVGWMAWLTSVSKVDELDGRNSFCFFLGFFS